MSGLVWLVLAVVCLSGIGADDLRVSQFYLQQSAVTAELVGSLQMPSLVSCADYCTTVQLCRYFNWIAEIQRCSLYTTACSGYPIANLYELSNYAINTTGGCCPMNKTLNSQGICVCSNGLFGENCDQSFTNQLSLVQEYQMDFGWGAAQVEIDGISYLVWLSQQGVSALYGYLQVFSWNAPVLQYSLSQVIEISGNPSEVRTFSYNNDGYLLVTTDRVAAETNSTPFLTYKFNRTLAQFVEINRDDENGVWSLEIYKRLNGEVYACDVMGSIPALPWPGPDIRKFNPVTSKFEVKFGINQTAVHRSCFLMEIDGTLFTAADSFNGESTGLYRLNADETWSFYQMLPYSGSLVGFTAVYIPWINTYLLAAGTAAGGVQIFRWISTEFTFCCIIESSSPVYHPQFTIVGNQVFLLVDAYNSQGTTFQMYHYVPQVFEFFSTISAAGPYGGFQPFWYRDHLYVMVINYYNGSAEVGDSLKNRAMQQLFLWS